MPRFLHYQALFIKPLLYSKKVIELNDPGFIEIAESLNDFTDFIDSDHGLLKPEFLAFSHNELLQRFNALIANRQIDEAFYLLKRQGNPGLCKDAGNYWKSNSEIARRCYELIPNTSILLKPVNATIQALKTQRAKKNC